MKLPKFLTTSIKLLVGTIVVAVVALLLLDYAGIYKTIKAYVVMSGSMEPEIKLGSVAVIRPQKIYKTGEVITFSTNEDGSNPVTHRIVFRRYSQGLGSAPTYLTAGDANQDLDRTEVKNSQVIGKVFFSIPYLGYAVNFVKQPKGFILLIIVPATIVIYEELKISLRELKKLIRSIFQKIKNLRIVKNYSPVKVPTINLLLKRKSTFPKLAAVIPMIGAILVFVSVTASFFYDQEMSTSNILGAAETFGEEPTPTPTPIPNGEPTPTPTPSPAADQLVINEVYYDSDARSHGGKTENDPVNEWIEIYNPTNSPVPFKNWQICDNNSCVTVNPNVNVPAFGFALVSRDASTWNFWTIPSGVEKVHSLGGTPLALRNGGDRVILLNPSAVEIDRMSWGDDTSGFSTGCSTTCPTVGDGESLERDPDGKDTDDTSDFVPRTTPTPGT